MVSRTPTHVFVTKYALHGKIPRVKVLRVEEDGYLAVVWPGGLNGAANFHPHDYALTREDAVKKFQVAKDKKIKALQRQIVAMTLKEAEFDVIE